MCVGLFFRMAFQQAGCRTYSIGPMTRDVYEKDFPARELIEPDVELDEHRGWGIESLLSRCRNIPRPDLIVMVDQYDQFHLVGEPSHALPAAYIAVENWNAEQRGRYETRKGWLEYHMIAHSNEAPLPEDSEWMIFGADPFVHPFLARPRTRLVCQIGSAYEPRPSIWNFLRKFFDDAAPHSEAEYKDTLPTSERTVFGRTDNYRIMAESYNSALAAISSSNVDFVPMRAAEAFSMGSVLLSDDVSSMRRAFGAPYPEDPMGIWVAHERTAESIAERVCFLRDDQDARLGIQMRALAMVHATHLYYHRALDVLRRAKLEDARLGRPIATRGDW